LYYYFVQTIKGRLEVNYVLSLKARVQYEGEDLTLQGEKEVCESSSASARA